MVLMYTYCSVASRLRQKSRPVIPMQHFRKYATVLKPLLGSSLHATMEVLLEVVFSVWSALS
jgi:hypothetical protein